MSTPEDVLWRVQALGYSPREAAFLQLVVEHSGYFLPRQVDAFYGQPRGQVRARFLAGLVARGHASVTTTVQQTSLFHVESRTLYRALGEEDNRNRRERPPHLIRSRLMTLDFVLVHQAVAFLPYGDARAGYLFEVHGVDLSALPTKHYPSRKGQAPSLRYFVDKYPAYRAGAGVPLSFCYVDEGAQTQSGFETYLGQYEHLFGALGAFQVVYVVEQGGSASAAAAAFRRWRQRLGVPVVRRSVIADPTVSDYFRRRHLFETGQGRELTRADLTALRNDRRRFEGEEWERQFVAWSQAQGASIDRGAAPSEPDAAGLRGFSVFELPHGYDLFHRTRRPSSFGAARRTAKGFAGSTLRSSGRSTSPTEKAQ